MLTAERLREVLNYDPETGLFTWRKRTGRKGYVGKPAGCLVKGEMRVNIGLDGKHYRAHRLAWFYVYGEWPSQEIDHINGDGSDNRMSNLRPANRLQNLVNKKCRRDNRSGVKGVTWHKQNRKWAAYIRVDGKNKYLGGFDDKYEAGRAYLAAAEKLWGEFATDRTE
jgi:hypothetical protein